MSQELSLSINIHETSKWPLVAVMIDNFFLLLTPLTFSLSQKHDIILFGPLVDVPPPLLLTTITSIILCFIVPLDGTFFSETPPVMDVIL